MAQRWTQRCEDFTSIRPKLSEHAGWLSIVFLFLSVIGLVFMWCYAWSQGLYPNPRADRIRMYGSAWGDNWLLENTYYFLALLPLCALTSSLISVVLKLNVRGLAAVSLSVAFFFTYAFHFSLVYDD
jgi:hypothetical protein